MTWQGASLVDGDLPPRFERWVVTVDPGASRPYDRWEWFGAIVVVHAGAIELEGTCGTRHGFRRGDLLWLDGLPLVALHNPGREPAVLAAVSRRPEAATRRIPPMHPSAPVAELDPRFSSSGAVAVPWEVAVRDVAEAQVWWLTTVRADGRPHVTPLLAVWHTEALHFCTGAGEQKARNLRTNDRVAMTTGCNRIGEGLDIVVEGVAEPVTDDGTLRDLAAAWEATHGPEWRFRVVDGAFDGDGGRALVFRVAPRVAFGFVKEPPYGQTRWRFPDPARP